MDNMDNKKTQDKEITQIRLPKHLARWASAVAGWQGISREQLIERWTKERLEKHWAHFATRDPNE